MKAYFHFIFTDLCTMKHFSNDNYSNRSQVSTQCTTVFFFSNA